MTVGFHRNITRTWKHMILKGNPDGNNMLTAILTSASVTVAAIIITAVARTSTFVASRIFPGHITPPCS